MSRRNPKSRAQPIVHLDASTTLSDDDERLHLRRQAILQRRDTAEGIIESHQSLLRELYHVLQSRTDMLSNTPATTRTQEDPPDLKQFLNEFSLANGSPKSITEFKDWGPSSPSPPLPPESGYAYVSQEYEESHIIDDPIDPTEHGGTYFGDADISLMESVPPDESDTSSLDGALKEYPGRQADIDAELKQILGQTARNGDSVDRQSDTYSDEDMDQSMPPEIPPRSQTVEDRMIAGPSRGTSYISARSGPSDSRADSFGGLVDDSQDNFFPLATKISLTRSSPLRPSLSPRRPKLESSPPPFIPSTISPALLQPETLPLTSDYTPIPLPPMSVDNTPVTMPPEAGPSTVSDVLPPLLSEYTASLYPLPPIVPETSKRKRHLKDVRRTTGGNPVIDLTRWEASITANPTVKLAKKNGKCLTTSEWQVMYNEIRYLRTMERINVLKARGVWSFRQPKKQRGPSLPKSHWDYMLEEMKWLQADFREERRWKLAVAMDLAYSAMEWCQAPPERRAELTARFRGPGPVGARLDGVEDADSRYIKEEPVDIEMGDVNAVAQLDVPITSGSAPKQAVPPAPKTPVSVDMADDVHDALEDLKDSSSRPKDEPETPDRTVDDLAPATSLVHVAGSEVDADGDADMDAEGEDDADDGEIGDGQLDIPDMNEDDHLVTDDSRDEPSTKIEAKIENDQQPVLSSTGSSIFDPKTLRGPLLDMELKDSVFSITDLIRKNLTIHDGPLDKEKEEAFENITLPDLFPELSAYTFSDPPSSETPDKKDRRVDESGMSTGRLTLTSRLMDVRPVLVSSLQPGRKYRQGVWEDPSDFPVIEEPRDYSDARAESVPPSATMFSGRKATDNVHPNHFVPPFEPKEPDQRLQWFTWSPEEDQLLRSLYNQFGLNWSLIADVFNSTRVTISTDARTPWDCFQRWVRMGNNSEDFPLGRMDTSSDAGGPSAASSGRRDLNLKNQKKPIQSKGPTKKTLRHNMLYEAIRKTVKKRDSKPIVKPRGTQHAHETHTPVSQQKHHTPAELTKMKHERDQQLMQQQILLERRRQDSARQAQLANSGRIPVRGAAMSPHTVAQIRAAQHMGPQVNIAQQGQQQAQMQQRMGATPLAAAQRLPTLTPAQRDQALHQAQKSMQMSMTQPQHPAVQMQQHQNAQMQELRQQLAAQQHQLQANGGHSSPSLQQQQTTGSPVVPHASSSQGQPSPHLNNSGIAGPSRQHAGSPQMQMGSGMTPQQMNGFARQAGLGPGVALTPEVLGKLQQAMHNGTQSSIEMKQAAVQQMIWQNQQNQQQQQRLANQSHQQGSPPGSGLPPGQASSPSAPSS